MKGEGGTLLPIPNETVAEPESRVRKREMSSAQRRRIPLVRPLVVDEETKVTFGYKASK